MMLLSILLLLFIFTILRLFFIKEGFQSETLQLNPDLINKYKSFVKFYNSFLSVWKETIITSISLDAPAPTEPSSPAEIFKRALPPTPAVAEMNQYINKYSTTLGKALPLITDNMPNMIDSTSLPKLLEIVPSDATPYQNALQWMNSNLAEAHKKLESSMNGTIEGFDSIDKFYSIEGYATTCDDVAVCMAQYEQNQRNQKIKQFQQRQDELSRRLDLFIQNQTLMNSFTLNQQLVKKSKDIQNKAQSGDLLKEFKFPDLNPIPSYSIPPGGDNLSKMKDEDPEKYKEYQQKYKQLFAIKELMEQINRNLR